MSNIPMNTARQKNLGGRVMGHPVESEEVKQKCFM
jgi:hypothetical protein